MRRKADELRGISEALLDELQMLFGTAQALRDFEATITGRRWTCEP
jgi:hypothetical protein